MNVVKKYGHFGVFTDIDQRLRAVKGKSDFMVDDFAKYRFAKPICIKSPHRLICRILIMVIQNKDVRLSGHPCFPFSMLLLECSVIWLSQ